MHLILMKNGHIVEAARLEKAQKWIGVSFWLSALWIEFQKELDPNLIMQHYDRHFKPRSEHMISHLVLDWPRRWREKFQGSAIDKLNELNKKKDYEHYYTNTIHFVKHSEINADWHKKYTQDLKRETKSP